MSEFKLNDFVKMTPEFLLFVKNKQEEVNKAPHLRYGASHNIYSVLYKYRYELGRVTAIHNEEKTLSICWGDSSKPTAFNNSLFITLDFNKVTLCNLKAFK